MEREKTDTKPILGKESSDAVDGDLRWREGEPTYDQLQDLAACLPDWKHVGSKLGVDHNRIRLIDKDHINYRNLQEKANEMFCFWKKSGPNRSYKVLGEALLKLEKYKLAEKFCGANTKQEQRDKMPSGQAVAESDDIRWIEGTPTEKELQNLAERLPADWTRLGSTLGLPQYTIDNFDLNVRYRDPQEKAFRMLLYWRDTGFNSTYETIGEALKALNKLRLATEFCAL